MRRMPTDAEWVASRIEDLPAQWGIDLVTRWERRKDHDYRGANIELREATKPFLGEPLPLDASDPVICEAAKHHAERCFSRAQLFKTIPSLRAAMERVCLGQGIEPPDADRADPPPMGSWVTYRYRGTHDGGLPRFASYLRVREDMPAR